MQDAKGFCYTRVPIAISIKRENFPIFEKKEEIIPPRTGLERKAPVLVETAGRATLAIVFKYFQIVDLLMNFFGKINVRIGQDL